MKHALSSYSEMVSFMNSVQVQLNDNLVVLMETEFDNTLEETDHKKRAKAVKAFNRSVKEVTPISHVIYPMQVRMMQMRTNVSFLLECAHNKVSYTALAKYFAEYDFITQQVKKEVKKSKEDILTEFVSRASCLNVNFFDLLMDTAKQMQTNILKRMEVSPEEYIHLNPQEDAYLDFDVVKNAFKEELKELKKSTT